MLDCCEKCCSCVRIANLVSCSNPPREIRNDYGRYAMGLASPQACLTYIQYKVLAESGVRPGRLRAKTLNPDPESYKFVSMGLAMAWHETSFLFLTLQTLTAQGWPLPATTEVWVLTSTSGAAPMTVEQRMRPYQQLADRLSDLPLGSQSTPRCALVSVSQS